MIWLCLEHASERGGSLQGGEARIALHGRRGAEGDDLLQGRDRGRGVAAQTIVVTRYQDGVVTGVDLAPLLLPGEDAIAAYNRLGYDALTTFVASAKISVSLDAATLAVPVNLRALHAAVATNYPEHADEAKVKDGPFMFAKVAQPTSSRAAIPASSGLLDYEVELCVVIGKNALYLKSPEGAADHILGYTISQDVSERH